MIYEKLQKARAAIKAMKLKKSGHNDYSGYDYFTPEQINAMVWQAENEAGLIHIFSLMHDCNGYHGELEIRDIETGEFVNFTQATEIPVIKATNAAQQVGGAVTYTLRYMLMTAYDIADNSLDFDAKDNRGEKPTGEIPELNLQSKLLIPAMPGGRFDKMIKMIKADPNDAGRLLSLARQSFTFTDDQEDIIRDWEDNLKT
jgi:hypothetical protein